MAVGGALRSESDEALGQSIGKCQVLLVCSLAYLVSFHLLERGRKPLLILFVHNPVG